MEGSVAERRTTSPGFCASLSAETGESLAATASRVDHWILVEYRRLWSREPVGGSGLADEVKEHLRAQIRALPRSRLLFVKRPDRRRDDAVAVFYADAREERPRLYGLELADHASLRSLEFARALAGEPVGERRDHPLLLVCTHGKRDRCCAKFGRPLYDELSEQVEADRLWQSTHLGGDRFAANLVCLPEGLYYGRVEPAAVSGILREYEAGRVALEHYRGRSCHPFPVQAGERAVREATGLTGLGELALQGAAAMGERAWAIRFRTRAGEIHEVDVVGELADSPTYLTCSATVPEYPRRYRAVAHRRLR